MWRPTKECRTWNWCILNRSWAKHSYIKIFFNIHEWREKKRQKRNNSSWILDGIVVFPALILGRKMLFIRNKSFGDKTTSKWCQTPVRNWNAENYKSKTEKKTFFFYYFTIAFNAITRWLFIDDYYFTSHIIWKNAKWKNI